MLREKKDNLGTKQCCANVQAEGAAELAAEQDACDPILAWPVLQLERCKTIVADLEQQLAAEREKYIELCDKANGDMIAHNKQLAAEREKVATLADALKRILDTLEHVTDTMRDINYPPLKVEPTCPTENKNA